MPSSSPRPDPPAPFSRTEIAILVLGLVVLGILRWLTVTSHHWNSDEPQHLHIVWSWTVGKLQYRDTFDNHTPLFHILFSPLLSWLGERADIVVPMRRAMIPLFAIAVACVYRLGTLVFNRRTGAFAALLAAFFPAFFFRMGEFRTDVLWTTLWLATLVVALGGQVRPRRTFAAALLLGASFAVSMKSTLLVLCLAVAGLVTWWLAGKPIAKSLPAHLAAFFAGLLLLPGAIVGYFASQGALQPLYHCVIAHNTMPGSHPGHSILKQLVSVSTLWLIPAALVTQAMLPAVRKDPAQGFRRLFLFLIAGTFYSLLRGFWPVVTTQDYLPWMPLLPIFAVAGLAFARNWLQTKTGVRLPWLIAPALLLLGEAAWIVRDSIQDQEPLLKTAEREKMSHLAVVLDLVKPGEFVFDLKGETIFRPRPTYLVFETLTRNQILNSVLIDDTIPRLIATRTAVARPSKRMMEPTKRFLEKNYVRVEGCHVLGKLLTVTPNTPRQFEIVIPETYGFISRGGPVSGILDGQPLTGPRQLEAGPHELIVPNALGDVAVFWSRAMERGYSPFHPSMENSDPD